MVGGRSDAGFDCSVSLRCRRRVFVLLCQESCWDEANIMGDLETNDRKAFLEEFQKHDLSYLSKEW